MATYKFRDVEKALLVCGFEHQKNNGGSHQAYVHKATGILQTIPKHASDQIAPGTAESILDFAIMQARIFNINICNNKYGLSKNVIDYAKKRHALIKQNFVYIIPEKTRITRNITTVEEAKNYITTIKLSASKGKPSGA